MRLILRFLEPYRWRLLRLMAMTITLSLLVMAPPLIMRAFIDRVVDQGQHSLFGVLGFCMVALPIIVALLSYLQVVGIALVGQRFVFDLRCELYRHLLHLSMRFYNKHSTGMLVNRLMGDTGLVANMLTGQTIGILSDLICSIFALSVTITLSWRMSLLILLIVIVFVVNYRVNIGGIHRLTRNYYRSFDRLSGGVQNRLTTTLAVKAFGTEAREQSQFREQSTTSMELMRGSAVAGNMFHTNVMLLQGVGRAVIYFLGCAMVLRGDLSYGDVVAFTSYAMQLLGPAVRFSELARQLQTVRVAMERILELLREGSEVNDRPGARTVARLTGAVGFKNVDFAYDLDHPVLENFNLDVSAGETIALIGPTGCGKTTLLSLLMRFYDVTGGSLLFDGIDVRDIRLHDLRRQFGIVLQEPLLFNVSLAENIRYGNARATRAQVQSAAGVAEIHDFIAGLPDGYETVYGSEGIQLSVGQRQRLTIARAVLADPAILIMDEATSALDSESERAIQNAMKRVLRNRTSFIVAHRLSTIREADRIILLREGRIVESGSHDTLMGLENGGYRELYTRHMSAGVLEE